MPDALKHITGVVPKTSFVKHNLLEIQLNTEKNF